MRRHHGRHRVEGPQALVRRRHQLPRPGRHLRAPGPARRAPARRRRARGAVEEGRAGDQRMLLDYKLFEPSFYTTDVPDWGTSLLHCQALGPKALVVVATGPPPPGGNTWLLCPLRL